MSEFPPDGVSPDDGQPPSGAAGPARPQRFRRWARPSRIAAWGALVAGPAALLLLVNLSPGVLTSRGTPPPRQMENVGAPSGYAELFMTLWLRSDARGEGAVVRRLRAMAPGVNLPEPSEGAQPDAARVTAVRSVHRPDGSWTVTVAVQTTGGRLSYFAVPLLTADTDGAEEIAVTAGPSRVAGPATLKVPDSAYRYPVPETSETGQTAEKFLSAYLTKTDAGKVERYLAPGVQLAPVDGPVYERVKAEQISADDPIATGPVPHDGVKTRIQVRLRAVDERAAWPLVYRLQISTRAGRWEITSADGGGASDFETQVPRAAGPGRSVGDTDEGQPVWAWGGAR